MGCGRVGEGGRAPSVWPTPAALLEFKGSEGCAAQADGAADSDWGFPASLARPTCHKAGSPAPRAAAAEILIGCTVPGRLPRLRSSRLRPLAAGRPLPLLAGRSGVTYTAMQATVLSGALLRAPAFRPAAGQRPGPAAGLEWRAKGARSTGPGEAAALLSEQGASRSCRGGGAAERLSCCCHPRLQSCAPLPQVQHHLCSRTLPASAPMLQVALLAASGACATAAPRRRPRRTTQPPTCLLPSARS